MYAKTVWDRAATIIQEILGAGWVQITRYDGARGEVFIMGISPFQIPNLNRLQIITDALKSPLNPFYRSHSGSTNFLTREVYLEGRPIQTTIDSFLQGILAPELLAVLTKHQSLHQVQVNPIQGPHGDIWGAILAYGGLKRAFDQVYPWEKFVQLCDELLGPQSDAPSRESIQEAAWNWNARAAERRTQHAEVLNTVVQGRLSAVNWRLTQILNDNDDLPEAIRGPLTTAREIVTNLATNQVYELGQELYPSLLRIGLLPGLSALINQNERAERILLSADEEMRVWDHPLDNRIAWHIRLASWTIAKLQLRTLTESDASDSIRVHAAVSQECLWLQIQEDSPSPLNRNPHRAEIDQCALLCGGTTYWSDHETSLMLILPLTYHVLGRSKEPIPASSE